MISVNTLQSYCTALSTTSIFLGSSVNNSKSLIFLYFLSVSCIISSAIDFISEIFCAKFNSFTISASSCSLLDSLAFFFCWTSWNSYRSIAFGFPLDLSLASLTLFFLYSLTFLRFSSFTSLFLSASARESTPNLLLSILIFDLNIHLKNMIWFAKCNINLWLAQNIERSYSSYS